MRAVSTPKQSAQAAASVSEQDQLDAVFFALSDPVRRSILERLGRGSQLVSEVAQPFDISLQAVSRHIQVLVRAGLVKQERAGRVARCSLDAAPVYTAAVWLNQYTEYWQRQFETLAGWLGELDAPASKAAQVSKRGNHQ